MTPGNGTPFEFTPVPIPSGPSAAVPSSPPAAEARPSAKSAVDAQLANYFSDDDYLVSKGQWAKSLKAAKLSPELEHRAKQIRRKSLSCIYAERESTVSSFVLSFVFLGTRALF